MELVWTRDGKRGTDTIHRAGCQHTRMADDINPLDARDVAAALVEIAQSMGWDDYPSDESGQAFDLHVSPCAK